MSWHHSTACSSKRRQIGFYSGLLICFVHYALNAQNLVTNPGFENGTTGWEGGSLTTTAVNTYSGSACGAASVTAFATVAWQDMLGRLQPGQTYRWSAWLRATTGPPTINMRLNQADSAGGRSIALATNTITTAWTRYSTTFSLSVTGALTGLNVAFIAGNILPVTLFLDDVSITNASPVLRIMPEHPSVVLSWPTTATNHTLQATTNLAAPSNWVVVTNTVQSNAAVFSVTLPATNRSSFFRLRHP